MVETKEKNELVTYDEFINNILDTRGRFACGEEYHETHHVVPKCMGGTNDSENLIDLFAREHFEAHRLLALENPDIQGLVLAWFLMSNAKADNQRQYKITAKEYEEARVTFSKKQSEIMAGNQIWTGRHHSSTSKEKQRQAKEGKYLGKDNPNYNNHKLSGKNNPMYGKTHSEDTREKISNRAKSRLSDIKNHPMYGKTHSEKAKRKISNSRRKDKVLCVETSIIYPSLSEAAKQTGINKNKISAVCNGKYGCKTAHGHHWNFVYDKTRKDGTIIQGAISLGFITEEEALKRLKETEQNN